jgi:predicted alpha/beta-fold hydrolase
MHPADYRPVTRWAGGHRMTLFGWASRRRFPRLPAPEARLFDVAPDTRVLAHCHWQEDRRSALTVVLLHGLEGSSDAHYIRGMADKAWGQGFNVVRLNQRNCGGTEHLSRSLYHSGLTHDPLTVMRALARSDGLARFAFAGYSLGGNLALKIAGELGEAAIPQVAAVAAVSPVMELATCVDAIERRENLLYHLNFVRNLRARMRRKARHWPGAFDLRPLRRIWTIRAFDDAYTAPHHGFAGAADYYHRASARRVIEGTRIPALILTAADDPFVPPGPFRDPAVTGHPLITTVVTAHGGHCGFRAAPGAGCDGYWAETQAIGFIARAAR